MKYYTETPISDKPEKAGYYHGLYDGTPTYDYFNGTEWRGHMSHWLKPITGVVMTEEQLKEMWVAAINYENDKRLGRLLNNSIDFTEYIKRFKQ